MNIVDQQPDNVAGREMPNGGQSQIIANPDGIELRRLESPGDDKKDKTVNKYAILIFCGALFIIFQLIALSIVYIASNDYESDAIDINTAGRQRMLSQRISKTLLSLNDSKLSDADRTAFLNELNLSYTVFDRTLKAFKDGGKTIGFDWESAIDIRKYEVSGKQESLDKALIIWEEYGPAVRRVLESYNSPRQSEDISAAVVLSKENNLKLLGLMNNMTTDLQVLSNERGSKLQLIQSLVLLAVIANFIFMAFGVVKKLKGADKQTQDLLTSVGNKNDELAVINDNLASTQNSLNDSHNDLQTAYQSLSQISADAEQRAHELAELSEDLSRVQQESDTIFDSVGHGLCLVGSDWKIGTQVSSAMYSIFETETLSGRSFLELMRPQITEKDSATLESFLDLLFQPKTSAKQLDKFNPLKSIEVTLNWDGQSFVSKHLGFDFKRVISNGEIVSILVTVMDVTDKVSLENELKRSAEGRERQVSLILEIIQSERSELEIFLGKTEKELDQINEVLRDSGVHSDNSGSLQDSQNLLENVYRRVHNIKGNSSLLGLSSVVESCSKVETELDSLREVKEITGDLFLSSIVELAYLRELLNDYDDLIHSLLKNFTPGVHVKSKAGSEDGSKWSELSNFVDKVAKDQNKKVGLNLLSFNTEKLDERQESEVKDILIQLARNSVVHGIESPSERLSRGKWAEGNIQLTSSLLDAKESPLGRETVQIDYRDDGRGLDPDSISSRALELGIISKAALEKLSDSQKVGLIFKPGFSTTTAVDEHSGRGAGMDIIREKILNALDGKIQLRYEKGKLFDLKIMIPVIS